MMYDDKTEIEAVGCASVEEEDPTCRCNGGTLDRNCDELVASHATTRRQLRVVAFHYLYLLDRLGYSISIEEAGAALIDGFGISYTDKDDFMYNLVLTVCENNNRYDELLIPYLQNWKLSRLGCCTRLILYLALAEFERDDAVASIVINEAVELAIVFSERESYRFVNGLLDEVKFLFPKALENDARQTKSSSSPSSSSSSSKSLNGSKKGAPAPSKKTGS
jgi:N utilization substance protein B